MLTNQSPRLPLHLQDLFFFSYICVLQMNVFIVLFPMSLCFLSVRTVLVSFFCWERIRVPVLAGEMRAQRGTYFNKEAVRDGVPIGILVECKCGGLNPPSCSRVTLALLFNLSPGFRGRELICRRVGGGGGK